MTTTPTLTGLRSALQLITQIEAEARVMTCPEAQTLRSIIARMGTIAHIALTRVDGPCVVNLDKPLSDMGIIRRALHAVLVDGPEDPDHEADIRRIIAAIDGAQGALAGYRSSKAAEVVATSLDGRDVPLADDCERCGGLLIKGEAGLCESCARTRHLWDVAPATSEDDFG